MPRKQLLAIAAPLILFGGAALRPCDCSHPDQACLANLRKIEADARQWATDHKKPAGAPLNIHDLPGYSKALPRCPAIGYYSLRRVGQAPLCSRLGEKIAARDVDELMQRHGNQFRRTHGQHPWWIHWAYP
jgi:hypothetical protein